MGRAIEGIKMTIRIDDVTMVEHFEGCPTSALCAVSYLNSARLHREHGFFDTADFFSNLARSVGNGYPPSDSRLFRGHTEPSQSYMTPEQLRSLKARAYG